jgi:hypothetical protein
MKLSGSLKLARENELRKYCITPLIFARIYLNLSYGFLKIIDRQLFWGIVNLQDTANCHFLGVCFSPLADLSEVNCLC